MFKINSENNITSNKRRTITHLCVWPSNLLHTIATIFCYVLFIAISIENACHMNKLNWNHHNTHTHISSPVQKWRKTKYFHPFFYFWAGVKRTSAQPNQHFWSRFQSAHFLAATFFSPVRVFTWCCKCINFFVCVSPLIQKCHCKLVKFV